jgi:hypothetical protein
MTRAEPRIEWDSFEELHVAVEQLELCQRMLRSRSHSRARAAVILLDHVADALMCRICVEEFGMQEFMEKVVPAALPQKRRARVLFSFDEKASYLSAKKRLFSSDEAAVLTVAHRIRNFAYHRNYHNPVTISVVGRILYNTTCAIFPALFQRGTQTYSSRTFEQSWTKRYGVTASMANFEDSLKSIAAQLSQQVPISVARAARAMRSDLSARYRSMQRTLRHWLALKSDKRLDEMLKHYEFADVQQVELSELMTPLKLARYAVHELHKDLPPEEWMKVEISPAKRRELRRGMLVAEREFKSDRRRLFRSFRQRVTAKSLRAMQREIQALPSAPSLGKLLCRYDSIERRLTQGETYVSQAEGDLDFAIDVARGK